VLADRTAYWDQVAWTKTFAHPLDTERFKRFVPRAGRVLDYGCGYGRICATLSELGYRNVVGFDPSAEMVRRGRQEHPGLDLRVHARGLPLPWPDGAFDAVILFAVLTCLPVDDEQIGCMREVYRLLCPGGVLYLSDFPLQEDARNQARYRENFDEFGVYGVFRLPGEGVFRHHGRERLASLTSGFVPLAEWEVETVSMNGNAVRVFQHLGRKPAFLTPPAGAGFQKACERPANRSL